MLSKLLTMTAMVCLILLCTAGLQASNQHRIEPAAVIVDVPTPSGWLPSPTLASQVPLYKIFSNWIGDVWEPHSRYEYIYDHSDNVLSETVLAWEASDWVNSERTSYTYKGAVSFTEALGEVWDGNKWIYEWRLVYNQGGLGSEEELVEQVWTGGEWLDESRIVYERKDGLIVSAVRSEWILGKWVEIERTLYAYDGSGNLVEQIDQVWGVSDWENVLRQEYTYGGGLLMVYLVQDWFGAWENQTQFRYSYRTDNQLASIVQEIPDGGHWIPTLQTTYDYDLFDVQIGFLVQSVVGGHELNISRQLYTHDGLGRRAFEWYQAWNEIPPPGHWDNKTQWEYGYDSPTAVADNPSTQSLPTGFTLSQNVPNPFNPTTEIAFDLDRKSQTRLTIYNVLGQEVVVLVDDILADGRYRLEWDAADRASGVYFYRLETESGTLIRKMMLLK
ncbi:MAG: T9SS type A sorting domain-containing protein [bacterium]